MNKKYVHRAVNKPRFLQASSAAATSLLVGFLPSICSGLGLSDIEYASRLGEPLQAKVHLLNVSPEIDESTLKIRQVSQQEAQALGIELISSGQKLDFTLNGTEIAFKSRWPVKEPYVEMLLEITWPTGKIYRTYSIFLDPPVMANAISASNATSTSKVTSNSVSTTTNIIENRAHSKYVTAPLTLDAKKYTVKNGDSLSKIAEQIAEHAHQPTIIAASWLYEKNPHAFINGNKNKIKAGYTIKLPQIHELANHTPNNEILANNARPSESTITNTTPIRLHSQNKPSNKVGYLTLSGTYDTKTPQEVFTKTKNKTLIADNALIEQLIKQNRDLKDRVSSLENSEYFSTVQELLALQQTEITQLKDTVVELTYQYENALSTIEITESNAGSLKIASASFFSLSSIEETPKNTLLWGIFVSTLLTALSIFGAAVRYMGRVQTLDIPEPSKRIRHPQEESAPPRESYTPTARESEYQHNHKIWGLPQEEQEKIHTIKSKIKEKVGVYTPSTGANTTNIYALEAIEVDEDLENYLKL